MTDVVREEAHAKLNLTLEVLGKRPDGYHDIASVVTTIDLHDVVVVGPASEITVRCDDAALGGEANLAYKAATALARVAGQVKGAAVTIEKRIPVAAGLGGGSADAAATLRALNRLWQLGLSIEELARIGSEVGSDVPFLVRSGTALVSGRGERIEPVPAPDMGRIVLLCPGIPLSGKTGALFGMLGPDSFTRKLAARIRTKGDVPAELMFNVFSSVAPRAFARWDEHRAAFAALGGREILLAGAGPSMFAKAPSKEMATAWQLLLGSRPGCRAFAVTTWDAAGGPKV